MWESPHNCALGPTLSAPTHSIRYALRIYANASTGLHCPPASALRFALRSSPDFRQRCLYSCPHLHHPPTQPCPPPAASTRVSGDLAVLNPVDTLQP